MSETAVATSQSAGQSFGAFASLLIQWVRRDFRVRYTQTVLGGVWAVIQPIALTAAFAFVFGRVAKINVGLPYASFVFPAMLVWSFFSGGLTNATLAMADSITIASRARYPRIVAPVAGALVPGVDLAVGLVLLPVLLFAQHTATGVSVLPLLGALVGALTLSIGFGTFIAALSVFVRDIKHVLPFTMNVLLLVTPVAYPQNELPSILRWNPIATFVGGFRSAVLATPGPSLWDWLRAFAVSGVALVFALWYFHRVEKRFPDVA